MVCICHFSSGGITVPSIGVVVVGAFAINAKGSHITFDKAKGS